MTESVPLLSKPQIVGYMSVDVDRNYHADLSQLKYLTKIPEGRLSLDLNHNINLAVKRTTDDNDEKISLMLKFLFNRQYLIDRNKYMFITYRRTLISVMYNVFNPQPLCILSTLYNGDIYLCSLDTPEEIKRRLSRSEQEKKMCAWGYKFEQYMLSDHPSLQPNVHRPVIENEEFSLYYSAVLGSHKLLYGAQIDGMMATDESSGSPPDTSDENTVLDYLRKNHYVELKTHREIHHHKQDRSFRKYKLLRCWCQCYLANLKGLLVGFRNDVGIVQGLKWFNTEDIVTYCKAEWNPETSLNYLDYFLTFVKNCFKTEFDRTSDKSKPINLLLEIDESNVIHVTKCDDNNLLPKWYLRD